MWLLWHDINILLLTTGQDCSMDKAQNNNFKIVTEFIY